MKKLFYLFAIIFSLSVSAQKDTLSVVYHTDNDFVIPKQIKIVYIGIVNEVFIDVPNSKSFEVEGIGVSKKEKNIYKISPSSGKEELIIKISGILKNGVRFSENQIFKIRSIPSLQTSLNNSVGVIKMQKQKLLNAVVKVSFPDKNIGYKWTIKSFELKIGGYSSIHIDGNSINEFYYNKIFNKLKRGDQITISNITLEKETGGFLCGLSPIIIEIY